MSGVGDEQTGVDAVDAVIDMLELAQEDEGSWPGPLTTATMESTLLTLARLGFGWVGAVSYQRWFLIRGQYLAPGGPVVMLATRLYLALQPSQDDARKRQQLAVHGFQAAVRQGAMHAVADSGDPAELTWLRTRVELDPEPLVRATAMQVVVTGQRGDPDLLGWLRDRATDQHADVRRAAVEAIASGWPDDPGTPEWLQARAFDQDETVRRAAVEAVAVGVDTLAWVMARARDLSPQVRLAALTAIAARPGDPEALKWLHARAKDQDGHVRMTAIQAIATGWATDSQTLPWLLARATTRPQSSIPLLEPEDTYGYWAGPDDDVRVAAIRAITAGQTGDPAVLNSLRAWATDQHPAARQAAVAALAGGWPDIFEAPAPTRQPDDGPSVVGPSVTPQTAVFADLDVLRNLATDPDAKPNVRRTAIRRLATGWPDDAGTLALLHDVAVNVPMYASPEVQAVAWSATQQIAVGWPDHPSTVPLLHEVMVCNPTTPTSLAAVRALVAGWPGDPETLRRLRDLASERTQAVLHYPVRAAAVALLVAAYRDDPGTLPLLKELMHDGSATAEVAAVRALAVGWPDDVATLPLLRTEVQTRLGGSGSWEAGLAAIEEIAVGWPDDPSTRPFLQACATDLRERFTDVRSAVFRALAVGWLNDPGIRPFLRERGRVEEDYERWTAARAVLIADPDAPETFDLVHSCCTHEAWNVRCDAVTAIATAWPDDPRTLPILLAATDDGHEWVEARALNAIAAGWPDHPQTLPLLRRRAEDAEHTKADTRMAALMSYVAVGPDDPQALAWLSWITPEVQRASVDRHRTSQS
jgi:HEAT repeat protein